MLSGYHHFDLKQREGIQGTIPQTRRKQLSLLACVERGGCAPGKVSSTPQQLL